MTKKVLIWFCGTGTTKEDMIKGVYDPHGLKLINPNSFDDMIILDGVGTKEATKATAFSSNKQPIFSITTRTVKDQYSGYREDVHIQHDIDLFNLIFRMKDIQEDIDLTISGHSRGAAVGLVSFLGQLLDQFKELKAGVSDQENTWNNVKKLRIIPVDPVQGKQAESEATNNFQTLPDNYNIETIISELSNLAFKNATIEVIVFSARFDARKDFKFDGKWKELVDANAFNRNNNANFNTSLVTAGFRHSAMVLLDDEISQLYGDTLDESITYGNSKKITPIKLLESILENQKGWKSKQYLLSAKELKILYRFVSKANDKKSNLISEKVSVYSYGIIHLISSFFNTQIFYGETSMSSFITKEEIENLPDDRKEVYGRYVFNF